MPFFIGPFVGWLISGTIKFIINYFRYGSEAKNRVGNGGFPSTHTTVMITPTVWIGLSEGFFTPIFGLAVAISYIVIIDATGLRRQVGKQAKVINIIAEENKVNNVLIKLRESMGHTKFEVFGGCFLGIILGFILNYIFTNIMQ